MQKLLIVGYVWPEPGSSAAGRHMLEIIQMFVERNWSVTFASPAAESTHQYDLSKMGVQQVAVELNNTSFDEWLASLQPDVVVFDRFMMEEQFGWRVAQVCPQAIRILDTEDLHFLRQAREQQLKQNAEDAALELYTETAIREIASIYRSDLSLIISSVELELLKEQFHIDSSLLHYLPFMASPVLSGCNDYKQRKDFVFVGTMRHAPNLDAVRWLKKHIWPLIRQQLPGVCLYIVGSYMTKEVSQMHKPSEGFHVLGKVEQLSDFLQQRRVSLAPLRFGAGLKGKLLESMENGLPSVTTTIGAEGLAQCDKWPGFIADDEQSFAEASVSLYMDENYWSKSQQQGFDLLQNNFSKHQYAQDFFYRIEQLKDSLESHRDKNFIGKILQHHSMRSTEYMARWIECKNRL